MKWNKILNRAKEKKDDEYYTYYKDVENIFKHIIDPKKYRIILPFNDQQSNFRVYCKKNELEHEVVYNDYKNHLYRKNDLVVSNPPFSKFREIVDYYMGHNIKFLLVAPLNSFTYKDNFNYWKQNRIHFINCNIKHFVRPGGEDQPVECFLMTNLSLDEFWEDYWSPTKPECKFDLLPDNKISVNAIGSDYLFLMNELKSAEVYWTCRILFTKFANKNRDKIIKAEDKLKKLDGSRYFKRILIKYEE